MKIYSLKLVFYALALWTMVSGLLAVSLRNVMHCAVALIAFFAGIAALFFTLHADFLGAVQLIVYVGAVAVLIVFAIMLTRNVAGMDTVSPMSGGALWGWVVSLAVLGLLAYSLADLAPNSGPVVPNTLTVAEIGQAMMTRFAIPFEVISLLLTAALVGAVVIALEEAKPKK